MLKNVSSFVNWTPKPMRISVRFMICLHHQCTNSNFISSYFNAIYGDECSYQLLTHVLGCFCQECNANATPV